jgi:hypothetical protein
VYYQPGPESERREKGCVVDKDVLDYGGGQRDLSD